MTARCQLTQARIPTVPNHAALATIRLLLADTIFGRLCWTTVSVATSRWLLTGAFNYPLHLLGFHLVVVQAVQAFTSSSKVYMTRNTFMSCGSLDLSTLCFMALSSPALVSGYKALSLSGTLPSPLMIMSLNWYPNRLLSRLIGLKLGYSDLIRYSVFLGGLLAICVFDYRLRYIPLKMSLAFLGFAGLGQVVAKQEVAFRKPYLRPYTGGRPVWQTCWPLPTFIVVTVLAVQTEPLHWQKHTLQFSTAVVFCSNMISTAVATFSFLSSPDMAAIKPQPEGEHLSLNDIAVRASLAGLTSIIGLSLDPARPALSSAWQCSRYIVALFSFATAGELENAGWRKFHSDPEGTGARHIATRTTSLAALAIVSWLLTCLAAFNQERPPLDFSRLRLDPSPMPHGDIDIVVARYDEPAINVAENINTILSIPKVRNMKSRIVIYDKAENQDGFHRDIVALASDHIELQLESLSNVGREGDAYLHHIVNNWDNLSTHTLFMQGEPHDLALTTHYLQRFLIPETGFLSLSYEGDVCKSCEQCPDTGWAEDPSLLSKLYAASNAERPCQNLALTYRGQFIVSAARIRGNDPVVYQNLLQQLRDPDSDLHSEEYTTSRWHRDQTDTLNDPVFGYTLERMWGVLMQCSNLRVGYWSPSSFAVWVRPVWLAGGFAVDDAQCLDRPIKAAIA